MHYPIECPMYNAVYAVPSIVLCIVGCQQVVNIDGSAAFHVRCEDCADNVFQESHPTLVWKDVIAIVDAMRASARGSSRADAIDGHHYFGLAHASVREMLHRLDGAAELLRCWPMALALCPIAHSINATAEQHGTPWCHAAPLCGIRCPAASSPEV